MYKLINWSELSNYLSGSNNTIRKDKQPKKYKDRIEKLLYYIHCWKNDIELSNMEDLKTQIKDKIDEI